MVLIKRLFTLFLASYLGSAAKKPKGIHKIRKKMLVGDSLYLEGQGKLKLGFSPLTGPQTSDLVAKEIY